MAAGKKTGGRTKGTLNKKTAAVIEKAAEGGEMPLDYMLRVMRDPSAEHSRRDDMAKSAAKFCHASLASVEHTGKDGGAIVVRFDAIDAKA